MVKVLESLVHPDYFIGEGQNKDLATLKLNEILKAYELFMESNLDTGVSYLTSSSGTFISTAVPRKEVKKTFTFSPSVFNYPTIEQNPKLVAIMMPFSAEFNAVYGAIRQACVNKKLICQRADNIWSNSAIMQDIFDLIYASKVVIVDYSTKNSNVMYETGIAHALGKSVIPITQSMEDVPFDLKAHRVLKYFPNSEGLAGLTCGLEKRLQTIIGVDSLYEIDIPCASLKGVGF